jgi:hypothetical protein
MDELSEHLKGWHAALESEFVASTNDVPDDLAEALRKKLRAHVMELGENLVSIAKYSDSDSCRLAATKLAISMAIPNPESGQADPLNDLIKQLAGNDPAPANDETT